LVAPVTQDAAAERGHHAQRHHPDDVQPGGFQAGEGTVDSEHERSCEIEDKQQRGFGHDRQPALLLLAGGRVAWQE
jgi:hypothetical protein